VFVHVNESEVVSRGITQAVINQVVRKVTQKFILNVKWLSLKCAQSSLIATVTTFEDNLNLASQFNIYIDVL